MGTNFIDTPIPALPKTHGLSTNTFYPPPLDGTLNVVKMYEWHEQHSPQHPVLKYERVETNDIRTIDFAEAARAMRKIASILARRVAHTRGKTHGKVPLVAILSSAGKSNSAVTDVLIQSVY